LNNRNVKLAVRIVCLILALMMVLGIVLSILPSSSEAHGELYDADMTVAIGLAYGAKAPTKYAVSSPEGFELGFDLNGAFYPVAESASSTVTVLSRDVVSYRVQIPVDESAADFEVQYAELSAIAKELSVHSFKAFMSKGLCVRMGAFSSKASAQKLCDTLSSKYGVYSYVVGGSATDINVLDKSGRMIFAFDCGTALDFSLRPIQPEKGKYYISAPDGYSYEGAMRFNRYKDAMTVASVLPIEDYVAGVLPYEISSSWNTETQKAFAVCVRSYTLTKLNKHDRTYGFDLCNTTDCQVYRGVSRITDTVRECVNATRGMVLTYEGKPIGAYYSSSTGGCTAGAYDVWGGTSFPYLSAAPTPWEKYDEHSGGSWTVEVSPTELYQALKKKGYALTGDVADIKINSLAKDSTYVSSITLTDVNGKSITIEKCDKIRIAMSAFLKSANFVVGKAGQTVTVTDYVTDVDLESKTTLSGLKARTVYGDKIVSVSNGVNTTSGKKKTLNGLTVITSKGTVPVSKVQGSVTCLPDLSSIEVKKVSHTVKLNGLSGNFVFVGRGYGHGVGMSQYGAKDLGDMGYSYDVILSSYFPKTEIKNMTVIN